MKSRNSARLLGRGAAKPAAGPLVPPVHPHVQRSSAPSVLEDVKEKSDSRAAAVKVGVPMSKVTILPQVLNIIANRMPR